MLKKIKFNQQIVDLRKSVLHPSGPVDRVLYSNDKDHEAIHIGYFQKETLVAIGTLLPESENSKKSFSEWRIRGMAVSQLAQGQGIGSQILEALILELKKSYQPDLIWCNARLKAFSLYTRQGFQIHGDEFEVPGSGPHKRLKLNF